MYETIAIIATLIILFFITWIVIACNSDKSSEPLPMPMPISTQRFEDTYKYQSIISRIENSQANILFLSEQIRVLNEKNSSIKDVSTKSLIDELKKRGALEDKQVIK
jgi:hypothetical protein